MLIKRRRAALIAGGALLLGAVLILWPDNAPPPAESTAPQQPQFPPPPPPAQAPVRQHEGRPVAAVSEEGNRRLPQCDGCLTERAVLDVVETYLRHLDPVYLQGDIWAQPLADIAPETPGRVHGQPPLPPGLLEAPEYNPFGMTINTRDYPVGTTWIVWVQTGWVPRRAIEQRIRRTDESTIGEMRTNNPLFFGELQSALEAAAPGTVLPDDSTTVRTASGDLPEVALSWPPIKKKAFVVVDARTGALHPDGMFELSSHGMSPPLPPHYDAVLDATRERVSRWLSSGGSEL